MNKVFVLSAILALAIPFSAGAVEQGMAAQVQAVSSAEIVKDVEETETSSEYGELGW